MIGPNNIDTEEYRSAMGGEGPHAFNWKDKPHRLVYDLCREIKRIEKLREMVIEQRDLLLKSSNPDIVRGNIEELNWVLRLFEMNLIGDPIYDGHGKQVGSA
jgi:hypothetical protein